MSGISLLPEPASSQMISADDAGIMKKRVLALSLTRKRFLLAAVMLSVAGDAGLGVPDTSRIRAQAPPSTSGLAFDASSVKANKSGSPTGDDRVIPGGRIHRDELVPSSSHSVCVRAVTPQSWTRALRSGGRTRLGSCPIASM